MTTKQTMYDRIYDYDRAVVSPRALATVLSDLEKKIEELQPKETEEAWGTKPVFPKLKMPSKIYGTDSEWQLTRMFDDKWMIHNLPNYIAHLKAEHISQAIEIVKKHIEPCLTYCREQNGLPSCKNCGLDDSLIKQLQALKNNYVKI